ncbi:hypothetical protein NDU88_010513 [Pleurodeles waltl]|uniref:Uncharacterized protein n=1 Tax=Pleurodeles waltl TaxID=8319 RepID=A0AAV7QUQ3_PLEWA|nr:hypothetical protein NDU88_010513 [Pleurodeles waltl]
MRWPHGRQEDGSLLQPGCHGLTAGACASSSAAAACSSECYVNSSGAPGQVCVVAVFYMERKGRKSTPPPGKAESSVQRGGPPGAHPGVPGAMSSGHRLRFVEAQVPGGLPLGASRSPGPSSTIALAACRTLLTSLGSPGGPHRRGRSHRGSFAARADPVEIKSSNRLGRRSSCSRRRQAGALCRPGHREPRLQLGQRRPFNPPGPTLQGPAPAPSRPPLHPRSRAVASRSRQLRVSPPGRFRLRRPFSHSGRVA